MNGKKEVDSKGSPISGVRLDVSKAYAGVPGLLQKFINENDSQAWTAITHKIDYLYSNLDFALTKLDQETGFGSGVQSQVRSGKKLLFKPNLVSPTVIDPATHGEGAGAPICTEWPLVAALMRWFHDKLDISYSQMSLGEASTSTFFLAHLFSGSAGRTITTEAVFEGRSGDFHGGWGFFFVRRYLAERHPASHQDDPLYGHEDSVAGRFIPPGRAGDRLMVYDLNKIKEDPATGRTVAVPDGANFKEITLHKAIIGGDPCNAEDLSDYPGCVLINVPKLKMHAQDLITNAVKNLGIGLYPTQCAEEKDNDVTAWKYAYPPTPMPSFKGKLPHSPWVLEMDEAAHLPIKDAKGEYIATKTAGFSGTQSDIIRAVQSQNVFLLHIVDAIDTINKSHNPDGKSVRVPEGYIWSSLDCVALDLLCARYCFKTVPMPAALKLKEENGWPTEFVRHVPVAIISGKNIVTGEGIDSPLFRYDLYRYAEQRGVGQQQYYVVGWDSLTETPLASLGGHPGRRDQAKFVELMTKTMYYNPLTILHDLQLTILSYAKACDGLTGSSVMKEFMDTFDENKDGVIDYDEKGRKGIDTAQFSLLAHTLHLQITEDYGLLKGGYLQTAFFVKNSEKSWNPQGHDFAKATALVQRAAAAFELSQSETVSADLFVPEMTFGGGKWPSWQTVDYLLTTGALYGSPSPGGISFESLYGCAFQYADKTLNAGAYTGSTGQTVTSPGSIQLYLAAVGQGKPPLDFTLYVPKGYGSLETVKIANVEETADPEKTFTVHFNKGREIW